LATRNATDLRSGANAPARIFAPKKTSSGELRSALEAQRLWPVA